MKEEQKERTIHVRLELTPEDRQRLRVLAAQAGQASNPYALRLLREALDRAEKGK